MIPIRNFPYSDYHDLNLDWLLRRIYQFEVDLEDLKRRVQRLEDWRAIAEPAINDLVSRMHIVEGNITIINNRLTLVEGDIVDIKGDIVNIKNDIVDIKGDIRTIINNSTSFYFYESNVNTVRCDYLGGTTFTMDSTALVDLVHKLQGNPAPTKGGLNYNVYTINSAGIVREADIMINAPTDSTIILEVISKQITNLEDYNRNTQTRYNTIRYTLSGGTYSSEFIYAIGYPVFKRGNVLIPASNWEPATDDVYQYKNYVVVHGLTDHSEVRAYFTTFADHKNYSDLLSDFIGFHHDPVDGNSIVVYSKEALLDDIYLDIFIDC